MRAHDAARQPGAGNINKGGAKIVSIRPQPRIVEKLRAVGLSVEFKRIDRYAVTVVVAERP